jgi:UDP-glucose 4-epimerase
MQALITGAAGFLGSSITQALLERGDRVRGMDCFIDYYPRAIKERNIRDYRRRAGYEFVEESLLDADLEGLLDGVDVVFHQAAQAGVRASWGAEFEIYTSNNVLATQRLLEACRPRKIRVVYASSSSVYGETAKFPMREDDLPAPVSPYGVTKLAAEHLCVLYWKNFRVPTVSLRYFTVYGPRQRPDMAFHKFIRALYRGEELPLYGTGDQTRDFTFVADAVAANLAAAEKGEPGGVYNIGGGSRCSVKDVFATLERITGIAPRIKRLPPQPGDVTHTGADISRAQRDLGYAPTIPLEQGLRAEVDYIQALTSEGL